VRDRGVDFFLVRAMRRPVAAVVALLCVCALSLPLPPKEEVAALCELAAQWGCRQNCSAGCGMCGALCDDTPRVTFL
jgi:hypothetical protein